MNATLQSWARALGGEVCGEQVLCPGPGHSAKDRSLAVTIGEDGQPIVHSFCGDDWQTCRDYVRSKLGMEPFQPNGGRKHVATYEFLDPTTGEVRYRKERVESADGTKSFLFKPKGRNGGEPLLYGGERLADLAEGQHVFVVEGEKKVDWLRELGAVAVSGDSGSSSKWLPAHADLLRGLPVVLWPDSDEPGEKYVARAADCLRNSPRPLGADSRKDSVRADAEEVEHFKKENGATRAIAADSVLAAIQSDADRASSAWGKSAVHPWDGENIVGYRRRVAREHQQHSPMWKDVDLRELTGQALRNAAAQIFADSIAASSSPATYGETLREVCRRGEGGHIIREFYGEPRSWMRDFAGGQPRLARFRLDRTNGA